MSHEHSEDDLGVSGELGCDVSPKLCKDLVGGTSLPNDLRRTSASQIMADTD